ncbi:hypothetical protein TRFO_23547 [Tritrichomonas foetus]|uniref:Uncharacterized protein n=1 Tax=Tritrichomonas foetus TaxID=1144522 RepID=A0A1J4KEF4_9EUKA|nr:hypothetical protein TRFO_23547 [Tritrichomonas foetus]|eukprot:OHT08092.1 hypothetical protein TRFO_23547 [Tritrichomonas foetus]
MEHTFDLRSIPLKHWDSSFLKARVEGRWTTFYHPKTNERINALPFLKTVKPASRSVEPGSTLRNIGLSKLSLSSPLNHQSTSITHNPSQSGSRQTSQCASRTVSRQNSFSFDEGLPFYDSYELHNMQLEKIAQQQEIIVEALPLCRNHVGESDLSVGSQFGAISEADEISANN